MQQTIDATLPLEDQLLQFALSELAAAEQRWLGKQMSDDYCYTNGSMPAYTAVIDKWHATASYIVSKYGLERPANIELASAYSPAEIAALAKAYEHTADSLVEDLHRFEDKWGEEVNHSQYQNYLWRLRQIKEAKRLCNYFSYLAGITHPYAGIDMLP